MDTEVLTAQRAIINETDREMALPETVLPVEARSSEGTVFLTVHRRKEGAAE